jgi:DNA-binding beta-propeller fold protein YncE
MRRLTSLLWLALFASLVGTALSAQRATDCNRPAREPVTYVAIAGGRPFEPVATPDGCWIFVTLARDTQADTGGVLVLRRAAGTVRVVRKIPVRGNLGGAVLTHDNTLLIIAAGPGVAFLDVGRMISGQGDALVGYLDTGEAVGFIYVNVTKDDQFVFASAERAAGIAVINLAKARRSGFDTTAVVGVIPVGNAPVAVYFSSDERYLYSTSQAALPAWNWPVACKPEGQDTATARPNHSQGAIVVVDVARARTDPARSVVARVAAGCNPVRLVTSPKGDVAYVTARGEHAVLAFDTQKLLTDSAHALIGRVPAGTAPVGIAVIDDGKRIVATSSNRFAGSASDTQSLTVIDAAKISSGAAAVLGEIPAGAFPRELRVTADGKTLLVTNFNSRTLQLVDLARLPLKPARHQAPAPFPGTRLTNRSATGVRK